MESDSFPMKIRQCLKKDSKANIAGEKVTKVEDDPFDLRIICFGRGILVNTLWDLLLRERVQYQTRSGGLGIGFSVQVRPLNRIGRPERLWLLILKESQPYNESCPRLITHKRFSA